MAAGEAAGVLHLDGWPAALDGLTLLHISDFHVGLRPSPVDGFLRRALAVQADVTVLTGDFVAKPEAAQRCAALLAPVAKLRPAFGIPGNHEHAIYGIPWPSHGHFMVKRRIDSAPILRALEAAGLTMLLNRRVMVQVRGAALTIAGLDDTFHGQADLDGALRGLPSTEGLVLLCHSPDILPQAAERGIPLVLSGHTHGGQVRFPLLGTPTTATRRPVRPPSGVLRQGRTTMHISPGLGVSFPPFRLFSRPEITVLELRGRPASG